MENLSIDDYDLFIDEPPCYQAETNAHITAHLQRNQPGQPAIARVKANRARREKYQAMRSLGLKRTPYGWE